MSKVPVVELRHITKRFPGIIANNDISLSIQAGEIYALLGENGAGKSTLMSVLFGLYEADEGEIWVRGQKVNIKTPNDANRLNIGMVHQHFKLVESYTVTENIVLGIEPKKRRFGFLPELDLATARSRVADLSRRYGLEVNPDALISDLPVSARQRVEILKMLYRDADILIFDEPTAVLTPQEIDYLLEILKKLQASGKTIILITHKLAEVKRVASRCAILNRGHLVDIRDVTTTSTHEMAELMVGRPLEQQLPKAPYQPGREVLRVEQLNVVNADGLSVLKDLSFSLHAGEVLAVAGVAGNGQVELAEAIAGLMPISSGDLYLNGQSLKDMSIRERYRAGIAYIPEDRQKVGLVLDFDLEANLALRNYDQAPYCQHHCLQSEAFRQNALRLIEQYDIRSAEGPKTQVRSMSGGNQQKAILAREIESPADVLIFVQPTRGLDIGAIQTIHRRILHERDRGRAILLVSLELDEILAVSDRIAVLYNGELQTLQAAKDLTARQLGQYMMGVHHVAKSKA